MKSRNIITDAEVEKRYEALPDDVAETFESAETSRLLFEIGKKQGLAIDKIGELAREVGYLMLGFVAAGEFIPDLTKIIGDQEKAKAVAQEINQKILLPIRESLKKTYGGQWPEEEKAAKLTMPPAPRMPTPPPAPQPPKKPEPIIIAPIAAKPKEEKPLAPVPKPIEPKPAQILRGKTWAGEPVKPLPTGPQPLIIYPLPMAERDRLGIRGRAAPIPEAKTIPEAKPAPQPLPAKPPASRATTYEAIREAAKKELEEFQKGEVAKETKVTEATKETAIPPRPTAPSPYVITKEELQKEIERFRNAGNRGQGLGVRPPAEKPEIKKEETKKLESAGPPPASAPKPTAPPLKLPQQKFPKPQVPEKYEIDPYRETTE